ncbi:MAG: hypothetical protein EP349_09415 [Alphaproteobacteria bacterium]|nr:MAG: hypothetical protein EP349_09415 [Alphaproteobacteria bacterium]
MVQQLNTKKPSPMTGKKKKTSEYVTEKTRKEFASYVEHPRYGRYPHYTGENPQNDYVDIHLHWRLKPEFCIANTAVAADLSRQSEALFPVTYYYDEKRICRDCDKPFIFFAQEQKHWYEDLGFFIDADCVRCIHCRKKEQWLARQKQRYDEFFHNTDRTADETLKMVDCCLTLIEEGIFTMKQEKQVRTLINSVKEQYAQQCAQLLERLNILKSVEEITDEEKEKS